MPARSPSSGAVAVAGLWSSDTAHRSGRPLGGSTGRRGACLGGCDGEDPDAGGEGAELRRSEGAVSHRRRGRLCRRARSVGATPPGAAGRHGNGIRSHPASRPDTSQPPRRCPAQGDEHAGRAGQGRRARGPRPRLRHPSRRRRRNPVRRPDPPDQEGRSAQAPPPRGLLPRLSRGGTGETGDRCRALRDGSGRHRRVEGHQARRRNHLRAGSQVGEVRWDAAQRHRCGRRRLRLASPRARA